MQTVGDGVARELWVEIITLFFRLSFVLCLPFSSDLLGGGQFALFWLVLGEDDKVTESLVKFLLELREVLPLERNQTALL